MEFARRHNAVILEDGYDSEFSRAARPLPALQTLDRERQRVLYVGTFSKSLYPGLRLGFLVAPPWIRPALNAARQLADWHGEPAQQDTLTAFIAEGHLARHVKRMRGLYAERHRALVAALAQHLGPHSAVIPGEGGLHTTALLRSRRPLPALVAAAAEDGLRIETIARFAAAPREAPQGLVFGLGGVAAEQMDAAIALLARHLG
nr:PLP-dependent aminotransferase family protein [Roseateles sp. DAIF2]